MTRASCAIAGLDTSGQRSLAQFGVSGLNCNSVVTAAGMGVAGQVPTTYQEQLPALLTASGNNGQTLGDRAANHALERAVMLLDWTYGACTCYPHSDALRWRRGKELIFGKRHRFVPLVLDCAAYRIWTGKAPRWANLDNYLQAISLMDPDGYFAFDVIGDQVQSMMNYQAMISMGLDPYPVYHVSPAWDKSATLNGYGARFLSQKARVAIANARRAAEDPAMRFYASKSQLIGLGGMVKGPIPREVRHYYIAELCKLMPDHQFWALGQANFKVINGLGPLGLLDRVWTDGTWWILDAAAERMAIMRQGQIEMLSVEGYANTFFTIKERMAANLRSLLAAYLGLWAWPPPEPLPLDLGDVEQVVELSSRMKQARMELGL